MLSLHLSPRKLGGGVGLQPVVILTVHKPLEHWATEVPDSPPGVSGRRAGWHQKLSRFNLTVQYIKGKDNVVADALSRYAYPASQSFADVSWHGAFLATQEMEEILQQEEKEGKENTWIGVVTRTGMDTRDRQKVEFGTMGSDWPWRRET